MLKLLGRNVGVDPIYDKKVGETGNKLTAEEIKYFESLGEPVPKELTQGLTIPDEALERTDQGIVKYVGPDVKDVQVGDYVLFSGYTGTTVRLDEGEGVVIILNEEYVTCKIEPVGEVEIFGLHFKDAEGQFWTVTYEMAIDLIRKRIEELDLHRPTKRQH